ncbi:MAG: MaoC family dehydratase N-terminal domain-containing protein [Ardenticatenales bacterium]|nr:MaoC family dehydratase N-terminal domain-containing protein [Ardenticatenales bacterium]
MNETADVRAVYQPRGLAFDAFHIGQRFVTAARTVTEADVVNFAGLSGDFNPLHTDQSFASSTPFGGRVAHGMLIAAIATGLANQLGVFEGTTLALMEQMLHYRGPVHLADTVHLELEVTAMKETSDGRRGLVTVNTVVVNQDDQTVMDGHWLLMMRRSG